MLIKQHKIDIDPISRNYFNTFVIYDNAGVTYYSRCRDNQPNSTYVILNSPHYLTTFTLKLIKEPNEY